MESQSSKITISFHACVLLPLVFLSSIPIVTTLLSYSIPAVSVKPFYYISIPIAVALTFGAWHLTKETFRDYTIALSTYELVALIAIMVICSLFILPTFYIGSRASLDTVYAMFVSDDEKHYAFISELTHAVYPPRNPFFAGEPLHYYYFYHLLTAILSIIIGVNIYLAKALTHLVVINLFILAFFFFAKKFLPTRQTIAATAFLCFIGGLGWIGNAIYSQKEDFLTNVGKQFTVGGYGIIDNSNWILYVSDNYIKMDFFYRVFLYVPQHVSAFAMMLCLLTVVLTFRNIKKEINWLYLPPLALLIGGIFGGSIFIFMGCAIILSPYMLYLLIKRRWKDAAFISVIFLAGAALVFPMFLDALRSTGDHILIFDPAFAARGTGLPTFIFVVFLGYGPFLVFGILGAIKMRRADESDKNIILLLLTITPFVMANIFRLNAIFNDFGMHLLRITWIGLAIYSISFFKDGVKNRLTPLFIVLCLFGFVSVAEDLSIYRKGLAIGDGIYDVFSFIRENTPETAIVQSAPYNRKQYAPFLSGRRVAVADDWNTLLSVNSKSVADVREEIDAALISSEAETTWQAMRRYKIDYLLLDYQDVLRYGASLEKLRLKPFFEVIYDKNETSVIKIMPQ